MQEVLARDVQRQVNGVIIMTQSHTLNFVAFVVSLMISSSLFLALLRDLPRDQSPGQYGLKMTLVSKEAV